MSSVITNFGATALSSVTTPTLFKWNPSLSGSAAFEVLEIGAANQVLTMNAGGTDFAWADAAAATFSPNIIDAATGTLVAGQPNIITYQGLCTVTLPSTCPVGQSIEISADQGSTFTIAQGTNQQIRGAGNRLSALGILGSVTMNIEGGTVELMCITQNDLFNVAYTSDSLTIVT